MKRKYMTATKWQEVMTYLGITQDQVNKAIEEIERPKITLSDEQIKKIEHDLTHFNKSAAYTTSKGTVRFVGPKPLTERWSFPKLGGEGGYRPKGYNKANTTRRAWANQRTNVPPSMVHARPSDVTNGVEPVGAR